MFFKQLSELGADLDVCIKVKEKNGKLTIMFTPEVGNKVAGINGKVITATPEELDVDFFTEIKKAAIRPEGANVQDLPADQEPVKPSTPKKEGAPASKKNDKRNAGKNDKPAKKKAGPSVTEASIFDQLPEGEAGEQIEEDQAGSDTSEPEYEEQADPE